MLAVLPKHVVSNFSNFQYGFLHDFMGPTWSEIVYIIKNYEYISMVIFNFLIPCRKFTIRRWGAGGRREAGTTTYIRMNKIVKNKITRYLIIFSKLRSKQYRLYLTYVTSNGFNIILGIYRFENGFNNTI